MTNRWRLLRTGETSGAVNMAVDEAILEAVAEGVSPPTLRFFAWAPPCLSLGYAQPFADVDAARLAGRGWEVVRRPTGGRAILHTDELTYSVIASLGEPLVTGGVIESYRRLSAGLLDGLARLGLAARSEAEFGSISSAAADPICFETPSDYEITARGKKLIGSAQVRKRNAVLQHGSLPLTGDIGRICDALVFPSESDRESTRDRLRRRATTVAEVLGAEVAWETAAQAFAEGFVAALALDLAPGQLTPAEAQRVECLTAERYGNAVWTARL